MSYLSGPRLTFSCLVFYLFACLIAGGIITLSGENALPVSVSMTGSVNKNLIDTDVYRVSINGSQRPLTVKNNIHANSILIKDALFKSYFQAIQIKLSDQQAATLSSITVNIGEKTFRFSRKELLSNWHIVSQSSRYRLYQSPNYVSAPRSFLPFWRKVINSDFGWAFIREIFIHRLPLLVVILTFLALSTQAGQNIIYHLQSLTTRDGKWPLYMAGGLAMMIALYRVPYIIWPIEPGLDPSWVVGLNWAISKELHWGKDLAFTYGPYYWLLYPNLELSPWLLWITMAVTIIVFVYSISVFIYYILLQVKRQKVTLNTAIIAVLTLAFFDYSLLDVAIVAGLLVLAIDGQHSYFKSVLPACLLLAILSLSKFSYLAVSLCIIFFYSAQCFYKQRYSRLLLIYLTFFVAIVTLWLLSGQPIINLGLFLSRAYEIAQGYPEAMATPIWNDAQSIAGNIMTNMSLLGIGVIFILVFVIAFLAAIRENKLWFEILLTAPVLFLAFKEGFIRMDLSHAILFFAQVLIVLIAYLIFYSEHKDQPFYIGTILIGSFVALLAITDAHIPIIYQPEMTSVFDRSLRAQTLTVNKRNLRSHYPLDQNAQNVIGNHSIDIIPYDISLIYGYGFNWDPRLVFQSYSVHSKVLDSLNASHFSMKYGPNYLLWSYKSIDNHYPLYDEPALLRNIIKNYSVTKSIANTYLLLKRKASSIGSLALKQPQPVIQHHSINESITIPVLPNYYTYIHANVELTFLGKFLNFLLKIQPLFIDVKLKDNPHIQRFRAIRQTTGDGLLVSSFAENFQMASDILAGHATPNVTSIKFIGNPWLYHSNITIVFRFEACPANG